MTYHLLDRYINAIAFGATELHRESTRDAYSTGYNQGYADALYDLDDTDQGDEDVEPFMSEDFGPAQLDAQDREAVTTEMRAAQLFEDIPSIPSPWDLSRYDMTVPKETASDEEYYDPFTRVDLDYGIPGFVPGDKVRVKEENIIDSQIVAGRKGYVIEVSEAEPFRTTGQTVLVGFPNPQIERPDKTYAQTWWVHPDALEVVT